MCRLNSPRSWPPARRHRAIAGSGWRSLPCWLELRRPRCHLDRPGVGHPGCVLDRAGIGWLHRANGGQTAEITQQHAQGATDGMLQFLQCLGDFLEPPPWVTCNTGCAPTEAAAHLAIFAEIVRVPRASRRLGIAQADGLERRKLCSKSSALLLNASAWNARRGT